MPKRTYRSHDLEFKHFLLIDPGLEGWRVLAAKWVHHDIRNTSMKLRTLNKFVTEYIHKYNLPKDPAVFLHRGYDLPSFHDLVTAHIKSGTLLNNMIHDFLDWVLHECFSAEDDEGFILIPHEFRNPCSQIIS